ncbi:MAG: peptide chain release factor N(5)-glutamine methyltransferase [Parcubacteria group bacterium]|nr:peptide chain release factor N(5)-glutamine methyltransferase [Parcubacteria group bacterium]
MTITQALKFATAKLTASYITDSPRLEAEILLAEVINQPREFLLAHAEKRLTKNQNTKYKLQITRRLKGEPIAYLIGRQEFYGLAFKVNKNVLIPRPETELMVEEALPLITRNPARPAGGSQPVTLIDIGTGSGCVIIALAKSIINYESSITNHKFIGIDISKSALGVARQNAKLHGVNKDIKFIKSNLLELILNSKFVIRNCKLIILANLPYLTASQIKNSPAIKREPRLALSGGKNGLELYEKLFKQIKKLRDVNILCEFDPRQSAKIKQLIKRELPQAALQIKKDLAGLNRLAIIELLSNDSGINTGIARLRI